MNKNTKRNIFQIGLFVITFVFATLSGAEWMHGWLFLYVPNPLGWDAFLDGMNYSIPFLLILTVHEFGHYLTARYHKVEVSLPYYLPAWFGFLGSISFGTVGAFIRIKQRIASVTQTFDIGIAGPLAGFVVAIGVLFYGFTNLPPKEYVFSIHPEYELFGDNYSEIVYSKDTFFLKSNLAKISEMGASRHEADTIYINHVEDMGIQLGSSILFDYMKNNWIPEDQLDRLPNDHEIMHYPYLLAGFLALMFTALNLLPIGQLDGGHVIFGMFGQKIHGYVSKSFYLIALFYSGLGVGFLGFINPFLMGRPLTDLLLDFLLYIGIIYYLVQRVFTQWQTRLIVALGIFVAQLATLYVVPGITGYSGWFLFVFILGRFIRVQHPATLTSEKLTPLRQALGWLALLIFIISFSLKPIVIG